MLAKQLRLTKQKDYDRVWQDGVASFTKMLGVKAVKTASLTSRVGVVVGVKVSKKAVVRNRIKRRIRAVIEDQKPVMKAGFDIVVVALPSIVDMESGDIKKAVLSCLQRLKLINE